MACPPALVAMLGREGTQEMGSLFGREREMPMTEERQWWEVALPVYLQMLRDQREEHRQGRIADKEEHLSSLREKLEHLWETENERDLLEDANERLRRELSLSKAREAALRDTIKLAMGGGGAQGGA